MAYVTYDPRVTGYYATTGTIIYYVTSGQAYTLVKYGSSSTDWALVPSGAPGPQGPQGIQGDTGPQGPAGPTSTGTALLDFGSFPGASDASVAVTGQAAITASSVLSVELGPSGTADHSLDEHIVEGIKIMAGNIVPGVGFTVYGQSTSPGNTRLYGKWLVQWRWS